MVTLVKDAITDEELRRKPPHKLFIINRCTLGVLLRLKIPLYLVKSGFIFYIFSLDVTAMCGFVQPLKGNLGSFIVPPNFDHRRHGS